MPFRIVVLLFSTAILCAAGLPQQGPMPQKRPEAAQTEPAPRKEAVTPTPSPLKPDTGQNPGNIEEPAEKNDAKALGENTGKPVEKPSPPPSVMAESDEEHAACMAELKALGATLEPAPRIDDGAGCGIDKPIVLKTVLPEISLNPEGTMRCETALELARWTKEAVLPAARAALENEGPLTTIHQASSYICRLRNNAKTGKISEHARGNAIDIASFTFKSGKTIVIEPRDEDSTLSGAFQRAVTASGCLYFETVLDPGSDEAHENHLHFDVLQRRGGYRYCR